VTTYGWGEAQYCCYGISKTACDGLDHWHFLGRCQSRGRGPIKGLKFIMSSAKLDYQAEGVAECRLQMQRPRYDGGMVIRQAEKRKQEFG
jgi:hypothetical protein